MGTVGFVGLVFRIWGADVGALESIVKGAGVVNADPEGISVVSLAPCAPLDLVRYGGIIRALAPMVYDSRAIVMAGSPGVAEKGMRAIFQGMTMLAQSQGMVWCAVSPDTVRDSAEMGTISALSHVRAWDGAADALILEVECSPEGLAAAAVYGLAVAYASRVSRTLARVRLSEKRFDLRMSVTRWIACSNADRSRSVPGWISVLWNNGALTGKADRRGSAIARAIDVDRPC